MVKKNFLQDYVKELIAGAGFDQLPASFQERYFQQVSMEVEKRLSLNLLKELSPLAWEKFKKLKLNLKRPKKQEIYKFFQKNVPDFEKKLEEELVEFSAEFLSRVQRVKRDLGV